MLFNNPTHRYTTAVVSSCQLMQTINTKYSYQFQFFVYLCRSKTLIFCVNSTEFTKKFYFSFDVLLFSVDCDLFFCNSSMIISIIAQIDICRIEDDDLIIDKNLLLFELFFVIFGFFFFLCFFFLIFQSFSLISLTF